MIIRIIVLFILIQISCFGQGTLLYLTEERLSDSISPLKYEEHSSIWPKLDRNAPFKHCFGGFFSGENAFAFDKNSPFSIYTRMGLGVQADLKISPKWYARVGYNFASLSNDTNYLDTRTYFYSRKANQVNGSHNLLGRVSFGRGLLQ